MPSRKYIAIVTGTTPASWFTPGAGGGYFVAGNQHTYYNDTFAASEWTLAVTPGNPLVVAAWWEDSSNRTPVSDWIVQDGGTVVASVQLNQQDDPGTAAAAASPPLSAFTGTNPADPPDDPNATDGSGASVPYAILWSGTPAHNTITISVAKDSSDTGGAGTNSIADTVLLQSPDPIPEPASVNLVQIGASGQLIAFWLASTGTGQPSTVTAVTTAPTIEVNGGLGNGAGGSTGTITLADPIWGFTSSTDPIPYVAYPLSFALLSTDVVTYSVADSAFTTAAGVSGALTGTAVNLTGGSLLPAFVPGRKSMRVGTNIENDVWYQAVMEFADRTRVMSDYVAGTYDFTIDGQGNLTSMGSNTSVFCDVVLPPADPAGSEGYSSYPATGTTTLTFELLSGGTTADTSLVEVAGGTTTPIGSPVLNGSTWSIAYTITPAAGKRAPTIIHVFRSPYVRNARIWPPGAATDGSQWFHPQFLRMASGYKCLRFMDALVTNASPVVDFSDFTPSALPTGQGGAASPPVSYQMSAIKRYGCTPANGVTVTTVSAYSNSDNYFVLNPEGQGVPVLLTFSGAHGIKEGQPVLLTSFNATFPTVNPTDTVTLNNYIYPAHVIDSTHIAIAIQGDVTGAGGPATQAISGSNAAGTGAVATGNSQVGWPLADCIYLCNLIGADLWINVPHAATDACITALFTLIAQQLNPGLKVHCEYSNETWDFAYGIAPQTEYCISQGNIHPGGVLSGDQWATFKSHLVWGIAQAALTAAGWTGTLVRTLGAQEGGAGGVSANRVSYATGHSITFDELALGLYAGAGPVESTLGATFDTLTDAQFLDLAALYLESGYYDGLVAANGSLLAGISPRPELVGYEGGGTDYEWTTASGQNLALRSRKVGRNPLAYWLELRYLQRLQNAGVTLFNPFYLAGVVGTSASAAAADPSDPAAYMWPSYVAWNQVDGTGASGENPSIDALDVIVSEKGGAYHYWAMLAAPSGGVTPVQIGGCGIGSPAVSIGPCGVT